MSRRQMTEKIGRLRSENNGLHTLVIEMSAEVVTMAEQRDEARAWARKLYRENGNHEIESMHNELAAYQDEIRRLNVLYDAQVGLMADARQEIAEHRRHVATVMQREAENARILAAVKHENQSLYEYRTRSIEDLKAKQAIIETLKSELAEVKAHEITYFTGAGQCDISGIYLNKTHYIHERYYDEALATCTELADELAEVKETATYLASLIRTAYLYDSPITTRQLRAIVEHLDAGEQDAK